MAPMIFRNVGAPEEAWVYMNHPRQAIVEDHRHNGVIVGSFAALL